MKPISPIIFLIARVAALLAIGFTNLHAADEVVRYETFGAKGDGVSDDLPAICMAHDHANKSGLAVHSTPGATYHLGRQALNAIIATDTNWNTSRFIIDDSNGVEKHDKPIFEIRSLLKSVPIKIDRLKKGQTTLDLKP